MGHKIEITILSGVSTGDKFRFQIEGEQSVLIGRSPECDLVLQDPTASRKHAELFVSHDGIYLADLGSSKGTVHMGFNLGMGRDNSRRTSEFDEFKVGESIFRINYDEAAFATKAVKTPNVSDDGAFNLLEKIKDQIGKFDKKHLGIAAIVLLAGVGYMLFGGEEEGGLPAQRSHIPVNVPLNGLVGYFNAGKGYKDLSRGDRIVFNLPSADLLVEYDYRSEAQVDVYLDSVLIEKIEAEPDVWEHRSLIVRDVLSGSDRKLTFDSLGYHSRGKNKPGVEPKRWAIRDIRMTPLSRTLDASLEKSLAASKGAISASDKSADGLFNALRAVQSAIFESVLELRLDGVGYASSLESLFPDPLEIGFTIEQMQDERKAQELDNALMNRHLGALTTVAARIDAELWRRLNSRIKSAERAAQMRKYINGYDDLMAAKAMFPDDGDFRWQLAEKNFTNNRIVPSKVRKKPNKYRR